MIGPYGVDFDSDFTKPWLAWSKAGPIKGELKSVCWISRWPSDDKRTAKLSERLVSRGDDGPVGLEISVAKLPEYHIPCSFADHLK